MRIEIKALLKFIRPWGAFISMFFVFSNLLFSQNASLPSGNFEVDEISGCAPFTVNITNEVIGGNTGTISYFYNNILDPTTCSLDYQRDPGGCTSDGNPNNSRENDFIAAKTFTYNTPGTYYIVHNNGTLNPAVVNYIKITVIDAIAPTFNVFACANNEVSVVIDSDQDNYDGYRINFGDGSPEEVVNKTPSLTEIPHNYALSGNYNIEVVGLASGNSANCNPGTSSITTLDGSPTPVIKSLEVMETTKLQINYESLDDRIGHSLIIKSEDGSQSDLITLDPSTNPTDFTYTNNNFDFVNTVYAVKIESADRCNATAIPSETIYSVAAQSSAAYVNSDIEINFDFASNANGLTQIHFYENNNSTVEFKKETGFVTRFLKSCTSVGSYYFEAKFGATTSKSILMIPDLNGTLSPPAIQNMEGELVNASFKLEIEQAPVNATLYAIYKKNPDGTFSPIGTSTTTDFTDTNLRPGELEVFYAVTYEDECGNTSEMSIEFRFDIPVGTVNLPNAFTPNGDGQNDTFVVGNGVFTNFSMQIFDRWGSLIFYSTNPNIGWDGNFNGAPASIGAYVYRISFQDAGNTPVQQTGTLVLIR
ncbi:gliding motility-associated C-terminal domain-containing protein [Roseivirga echinicomitans]